MSQLAFASIEAEIPQGSRDRGAPRAESPPDSDGFGRRGGQVFSVGVAMRQRGAKGRAKTRPLGGAVAPYIRCRSCGASRVSTQRRRREVL